MMKAAPSILSADFGNLKQQCLCVLEAGADYLHFDVMDGHFVPNISFGIPVLKSLHKAVPQAVYDVHLMISHPLQYAAEFAKAGADYIVFHAECEDDIAATIAAIRAAGCRVGLAVNPGTPAETLWPWLDQLDLVLIMSVQPGFGGQSFMPVALDKLRAVADRCAALGLAPLIEVDGGINADTAVQCARAGANLLVAGSYVFSAADPAAVVRQLKAL